MSGIIEAYDVHLHCSIHVSGIPNVVDGVGGIGDISNIIILLLISCTRMCPATQADITAFRTGDIVKLADAVESEVAVVAGIAACR